MQSITAKKKILHVLWSGRSGGAERFVRDITHYSDREKFEHAVCFLSKGGWLADEIADSGAKIYFLGMNGGFSIIQSFKLFGVIKQFKPDIINSHARNYLSNLVIILFPRLLKVYFEHGGNLVSNKPNKDVIFYNLFGRFYSLVLVNSNYVREKILGLTMFDPKKIKTFYIGIDLTKYRKVKNNNLKIKLGIPEQNKVVGFVGRLVEAKGLDDFIEVVAEIEKKEKNVSCSYVIVGEGVLRAKLEEMAQKRNVDIKFLGDSKNVPEVMRILDIFLFTSKWESFGIVLLEAMASKIPIVGFLVPGAKEILEQGGSILIEERSPHKIAAIVIDLLNHGEKINHLLELGYFNVSQNFNIRKNIKRLEEYYCLLS